MKLVKLSLVAAMAAGVFATTASAVPLEEAIKDVDVSGYTRLRYTHTTNDTGDKEDGKSQWNFKGVLNLKTKIDDNFFAVVGLQYNDTDMGSAYYDEDEKENKYKRSTAKPSKDIKLHQAYFGYNVYGTTITAGRQEVGTFFTDDMFGDGIKVTNTDIEGLTLAALWMDSLEDDSDVAINKYKVNDKMATDHNLYGVGAMGNYDPVSFQLWYAVVENVADLFAVELAMDLDVTEDFALGLKGQYAFADLDSDYKNLKGDDKLGDSDFYAIEASTGVFGLDLSAGYVNYSTDKDKKSLSSFEDDGKFISAGEEVVGYASYKGENDYWFVTAAYTIPDTGITIGADYLDGKTKFNDGKTDFKEAVARINYKHNKKLSFKSWYSWSEEDSGNNKKTDTDKIRFEAKYSF